MKSENIEPFVSENKRECAAIFDSYKDNVDTPVTTTTFEPPTQNDVPKIPIALPSTKPDLRSAIRGPREPCVNSLFRGVCFAWLKSGHCNRYAPTENANPCRFQHSVSPRTFFREIFYFFIISFRVI